MTKLYAPDRACVEMSVQKGGYETLYRRQRDGSMEVTNKAHIAALKALGATEKVTGVTTRPAFVCTACGFRAVFKTCGRCGAACEKETNGPA